MLLRKCTTEKLIEKRAGNSPPKGLNGVVYVHGLHYLHLILRSANTKVDPRESYTPLILLISPKVEFLKLNTYNIPPKMRCNGDALCAGCPKNETTSYSNFQESRFVISQHFQSEKIDN